MYTTDSICNFFLVLRIALLWSALLSTVSPHFLGPFLCKHFGFLFVKPRAFCSLLAHHANCFVFCFVCFALCLLCILLCICITKQNTKGKFFMKIFREKIFHRKFFREKTLTKRLLQNRFVANNQKTYHRWAPIWDNKSAPICPRGVFFLICSALGAQGRQKGAQG